MKKVTGYSFLLFALGLFVGIFLKTLFSTLFLILLFSLLGFYLFTSC